MNLQTLLSSRKKDILKKWQEKIFLLYPADSKKFLTSVTNQFANPVGYSIKEKTESLFDELVNEGELNQVKVESSLDEIIKILAIQDFSPSQAVAFIYLLKDVITDELINSPEHFKNMFIDVVSFYSKIDKAALTAFGIYSNCREKLYEIKVESAKNQISGLLRRSDLVGDAPKWGPAENK